MATPRKPKIKPFTWSDMNLTSAQGVELAALGMIPEQTARVVDLPVPGLPEHYVARDEQGRFVRYPMTQWAYSSLSKCFEGCPEDAAEKLARGDLPGKLLVPMTEVLQPLRYLFPVSQENAVAPEWELALEVLGLPPTRPMWRGTVAGALTRGYLTPLQALSLCEGHSLAAMKTLTQSREEAKALVEAAVRQAVVIVDTATHTSSALVEAAKKDVQDIHRRAELDLVKVSFGEADPWVEVLEEEIHRANRFRIGLEVGKIRYSVHVDWYEDRIEVVRGRDAVSWVLTQDQLQEDPKRSEFRAFLAPLQEALEKFNSYQEGLPDLDGDLSAALRQFRARNALEKLASRLEGQLQLTLDL